MGSQHDENGFRVYLLACVWGLRNKDDSHLDREFGSAWGHDGGAAPRRVE